MAGYEPDRWTDLAVMLGGATAALIGLLFVAVSINLREILSYPGLPDRALQTLTLFGASLLVCLLLLVPGQPDAVLGAELVVVAVLAGVGLLRLSRRVATDLTARRRRLPYEAASTAFVLALAAAGATLPAGSAGGLYWLVPAIVIALLAGLANAWVLLVEILR
jgi:hypothetical protein